MSATWKLLKKEKKYEQSLEDAEDIGEVITV